MQGMIEKLMKNMQGIRKVFESNGEEVRQLEVDKLNQIGYNTDDIKGKEKEYSRKG